MQTYNVDVPIADTSLKIFSRFTQLWEFWTIDPFSCGHVEYVDSSTDLAIGSISATNEVHVIVRVD